MMRRPLSYATASFVLGIIICNYLGNYIAFIPIVIFILKTPDTNKKVAWVVLLFYVISFINFEIYNINDKYIKEKINSGSSFFGTVKSLELCKNSYGVKYYTLEVDLNMVDNDKLNHKARVIVKCYSNDEQFENEFEIGCSVSFDGEVEKTEFSVNPGCFDYEQYLNCIDIKCILVNKNGIVYNNELISVLDKYKGGLNRYKNDFLNQVCDFTGTNTADIMGAILFGDKSGLDENTYEVFQKNGTAHVLAVSGLHIGIIYSLLMKLWKWKRNWLFLLIVSLFFWSYTILAEFAPSVVRAVMMLEIHILSQILNRKYDMISAACAVLLFTLLNNPFSIFNAGIQMSYIAVVSIAMVMPVIRKKYNGVLLCSLAVQIGLLPYSIYSFNYISIVTVFINVPVIFLTSILLAVGLIAMFVSTFNEMLFEILNVIMYGLCELLIEVNTFSCVDGMTTFDVVSPSIITIILTYGLMIFLFSEEGRLLILRKKLLTICIVISFVMLFSCIVGGAMISPLNKCNLIFVDVGQGDCVHVRYKGKNYLIDGGGDIDYNVGKKTLKTYLLKNGVKKIDAAFVTHLHTDHYKGIVELCNEGMIKRMFLYEGYKLKTNTIIDETALKKEDVFFLYKGNKVVLDKNLWIEILWPERKTDFEYKEQSENESDENESCLVFKLHIEGVSVMITGDIDEECMNTLSEMYGENLKSDVIKVPHHGSKYSYSDVFIDMVSPGYAVFQVGRNNFGHPDKGVVDNYIRKGIITYRNDYNGAVGFIIKEHDEIKAAYMRKRK